MTIYLDLKTIGLGNNLFMISAAMQLALEKSTDFVCLPIASKGFNDEILNSKTLRILSEIVPALGGRFISDKKELNYVNRLQRFNETCAYCFDKSYYKIDNDFILSGYFQNDLYSRNVRTEIVDKLLSLRSRISLNNNLAIQIRLGDFNTKTIRNSNGQLSKLYFHKVFSRLMHTDKLKNQIVTIFSDGSFPEINDFLNPSKYFQNFEIVLASEDILTDLVTLSSYNELFISNSTFAWWASVLGENRSEFQFVISPSQWNKSQKCSVLLPKTNWIRLNSIWR